MHSFARLHSVKNIYDQISQGIPFSHAYLLYGVKGSGKTASAIEYSSVFLNKKILTLNSQIDFLYIQPSQSSVSIRLPFINGQNKELEQPSVKDFLLTPPLKHRFKVVMIKDVDRLTLEAAHALLKILEEPPCFAKFILTTSCRHEVLSTITSRCININCELPSKAQQNKFSSTLVENIFSTNVLTTEKMFDLFEKLHHILDQSSNHSKLKTAEKFRNWCDEYSKQTGIPSRLALTKGIEYVALWFLHFKHYDKAQKVCQFHKFTRFNFHVNYFIDSFALDIF